MDKKLTEKFLIDIFGDDFSNQPSTINKYSTDNSNISDAMASFITFPRSSKQLISLINNARKFKYTLVPSGGRTGFNGGASAINHEIIVSFERMNKIISFSKADAQIICQPGVTGSSIQNIAQDNNLFWPINYAATTDAQIGGNVSTNAGGMNVIKYGSTRNWVAGLKIITGTGEELSLNNGLIKKSCGYDLRHIFIGAEGTLGFISEVTVQLTKPPKCVETALLSSDSMLQIVESLTHLKENYELLAFEFFDRLAYEHSIKYCPSCIKIKNNSSSFALIEVEKTQYYELEESLQLLKNKGLINNIYFSQNKNERDSLWQIRNNISKSLSKFMPLKFDVSVKISDIHNICNTLSEGLKKKFGSLSCSMFGHVGDGNVHVNIFDDQNLVPVSSLLIEEISDFVYSSVANLTGSISAEHGIGAIKKGYLHYTCTESEINFMKAIKKVFDPFNIMNPGKIFI